MQFRSLLLSTFAVLAWTAPAKDEERGISNELGMAYKDRNYEQRPRGPSEAQVNAIHARQGYPDGYYEDEAYVPPRSKRDEVEEAEVKAIRARQGYPDGYYEDEAYVPPKAKRVATEDDM
ncbi:hypothetical protein CB0940_10901 [Cercospora beticola]|uniref:Uncharacterized protein n=1 Tax=Cercospora beticola TaxID=122368 RepID=A0A2G5HE32_CERBT|nr:hypothetical protein CB0940_10901 [Cercospora beticola]PIA90797.1 hypothetical protein CB0940_10901 [Cercospora beticola]WPB07761.1 hypothetical protein RHO25_012425 [Cercospora beticola]